MNLFGTAGIRGPVSRVTPELALAVGRAAGTDARAMDDSPTFVVARDGRETGPALAAALEAGLESTGVAVRRAGPLPTPALAFASRGRRGVMVTASHNPPADNGLKLFVDGQEYDDDAEARLEAEIEDETGPAAWEEWTSAESIDPLSAYREAVANYARAFGTALDGLGVVVDCGNGMASQATPAVLEALGADVTALNANVDGTFPARGSKPTPETLGDIRRFLAEGEADIGFAHDGDADRIVVLDGRGEIVHEDTIVAVLAERYTRTSDSEDPVVVTTPNASSRIDERVEAAGGRVERVRLGALHEGVAAAHAGGDDTRVVFAAEPWKHVHPEHGPWIDGVASAGVLARLVASEGLDTLRDPVQERPYRKVSLDCPDERKDSVMERLTTVLRDEFPEGELSTEHGVRVELADGWILVRPSGTEPKVRIYAESDRVDDLVDRTRRTIERLID